MAFMSGQSRLESFNRSSITKLASFTLGNILLLVSLLFFTAGFLSSELFPREPLSQPENNKNGPERAAVGDARFDRVVFLLIDALRPDFVYGRHSGFGFTQRHASISRHQIAVRYPADSDCNSLISDGSSIPFTAHVAPPTVTLPRLKALTTGSIPGFADVMGNLDQSDASLFQSQDSWLRRLHASGGKLVFYGDDTWLRLFGSTTSNSSYFARSEGVDGFVTSVSWGEETDPWISIVLTRRYAGLHRSRQQRHPPRCGRDGAERLERDDPPLSRSRPHRTHEWAPSSTHDQKAKADGRCSEDDLRSH
jgi:predicted AlkP superfamily pyrophosphatase or phosphodiesterase